MFLENVAMDNKIWRMQFFQRNKKDIRCRKVSRRRKSGLWICGAGSISWDPGAGSFSWDPVAGSFFWDPGAGSSPCLLDQQGHCITSFSDLGDRYTNQEQIGTLRDIFLRKS